MRKKRETRKRHSEKERKKETKKQRNKETKRETEYILTDFSEWCVSIQIDEFNQCKGGIIAD